MNVVRDFIDISSGQMHLRRSGTRNDKPTIICLHMMPKSSRGFTKLLPELAQHTQVIAPDYPGYGESDPFAFSNPTISDYAKSIAELIDHFELDAVDLVGYHTGSMVAVELAAEYPSLVNQLVCISTPVLSPAEIEHYKRFFSPIPLDKAGTRFSIMWSRVVEFSGPGMTLEMCATSMAENLRAGERYEDGHIAAFNYSLEFVEKISLLEQPLLALNIGDDLYHQSKRIIDQLGGGYYQEYPHWGHGLLELAPQELADVLMKFFYQQALP